MLKIKYFIFSIIIASCTQIKQRQPDAPLPDSLEAAVESGFRLPQNRERDEYQHPLETLKFFGIKKHMTVAEISPGAGYFTEILAPFLAEHGQYLMVVPRLPSRPPAVLIENEKKLQEILVSNPKLQAKSKFIPFEPIGPKNKVQTDSVDVIISISSVHNWVANRSSNFAFDFFFKLLKPGGVLGIVQHRAPSNKRIGPKSGYLTEKVVIAMAMRAGFKLLAKSEINANPKDTADYPGGVWTLPPFYRLGDKDREKYEEIGESDRMTLKFIKPKK